MRIAWVFIPASPEPSPAPALARATLQRHALAVLQVKQNGCPLTQEEVQVIQKVGASRRVALQLRLRVASVEASALARERGSDATWCRRATRLLHMLPRSVFMHAWVVPSA